MRLGSGLGTPALLLARSLGRSRFAVRLLGCLSLTCVVGVLLPGAAAAESPLLNVEGMIFVATRDDVNELVLHAARARFHTEQERVYLQDVRAVVEPSAQKGSFEIRCDEGELDIATNDFEAVGNVRGRTEGDREFSAAWVKYDHEAGLLFTNAPVLITEGSITYRGGGFQYYVRERRFRLLGGASVVQQPGTAALDGESEADS